MDSKIKWEEFNTGFMGVLPCGIVIVIARVIEGKYLGAYAVRFGTAQSPEYFWNPATAKAEGIRLARKVLTECLLALG